MNGMWQSAQQRRVAIEEFRRNELKSLKEVRPNPDDDTSKFSDKVASNGAALSVKTSRRSSR